MTVKLNRKQVLAISKLNFTGLGHSQRLDLIAKALGMRNQATMMSVLNTQGPERAPAKIKLFHMDIGVKVDPEELITDLLTAVPDGMFSKGLHIFGSPTAMDQEAFAVLLAARLIAKGSETPPVMVLRSEDSVREAFSLAERGPVFGCIHAGHAIGAVRRMLNLGAGGTKIAGLGSVSVLSTDLDVDTEKMTIKVATGASVLQALTEGADPELLFSADMIMKKGSVFDKRSRLMAAYAAENGLRILSGPVGSGKSSTLDDLLRKLSS